VDRCRVAGAGRKVTLWHEADTGIQVDGQISEKKCCLARQAKGVMSISGAGLRGTSVT
jgi:hypothetical protein